ncbi:MAG: FixH family protein [Burkholderiaceae bacterium]
MKAVSINPNSPIDNKPWYAQRWPWLLMLGPFLVVLAASYTGWIAFSRQDALVVDDYYKQGRAINQDLRRDHAATNLGLRFNMHYDPAHGQLTGQLGTFDAPQSGKLLIHLIHSTLPEKDVALVVQSDAQGKFSVMLPMLEASRWQVLIENEKRDWRLNGVWSWPQQQSIEIKADPAPAD